MNKSEFISNVAAEADMTKADAEKAVNAMQSCIATALKQGDKVQLVGFGTFQVSASAAREGRNPRTGETIKIAARNNARFKAGKALQDAVNS